MFQAKCQLKLRELSQSGKTVLLVSHNPKTVSELCDRCVWIDAGRLRAVGEVTDVLRAYANSADLTEHFLPR
jgi:lipopolysaccharide transport system ATP-binding protein